MEKSMRYITVEEHEMFRKLVDEWDIKGYSPPTSLMCYPITPNSSKLAEQWMENKSKKTKYR